jgi:P27 family predicted phage terminase small subunit
MPPCPPRFKELAQRVWKDVGPQLIADGLISERDLMPFTAYCEMFEIIEQINNQMLKKGYDTPMIVSPSTKQLCINPLFRFKHQILTQIRVFGSEFGLTPSSRTKAGLKPYKHPSAQVDPLSEFMPHPATPPGARR